MNIRSLVRNRIAGFILGRYNLDQISNKMMTEDEFYVSGIEIINYDELMYFTTLILTLGTLYISIVISPIFLLFAVVILFMLFIATDLELIMILSERVLIERRSLVEKLTRTENFQSISIDQIAVISYARAPPNTLALLVGIFGLGLAIIPFFLNIILFEIWMTVPLVVILLSAGYLTWFGARLYKRSIELSIIGLNQSIGLGRVKGAPLWFLLVIQNMVYERIHHTFHTESGELGEHLRVEEFPLEYSAQVKQYLGKTNELIEQQCLVILDESTSTEFRIQQLLPNYTLSQIESTLDLLRKKGFAEYNRNTELWQMNRNYQDKKEQLLREEFSWYDWLNDFNNRDSPLKMHYRWTNFELVGNAIPKMRFSKWLEKHGQLTINGKRIPWYKLGTNFSLIKRVIDTKIRNNAKDKEPYFYDKIRDDLIINKELPVLNANISGNDELFRSAILIHFFLKKAKEFQNQNPSIYLKVHRTKSRSGLSIKFESYELDSHGNVDLSLKEVEELEISGIKPPKTIFKLDEEDVSQLQEDFVFMTTSGTIQAMNNDQDLSKFILTSETINSKTNYKLYKTVISKLIQEPITEKNLEKGILLLRNAEDYIINLYNERMNVYLFDYLEQMIDFQDQQIFTINYQQLALASLDKRYKFINHLTKFKDRFSTFSPILKQHKTPIWRVDDKIGVVNTELDPVSYIILRLAMISNLNPEKSRNFSLNFSNPSFILSCFIEKVLEPSSLGSFSNITLEDKLNNLILIFDSIYDYNNPKTFEDIYKSINISLPKEESRPELKKILGLGRLSDNELESLIDQVILSK